ncbi:MAG: LamG-like jellyroll fold domain-containing protein [Methanobacteriota archaeon]
MGTEIRPHIKPHIKGKSYHITPIKTITDGNWHHFVYVRSGSEISVYVDGKFQGVWTNAPTGNLIIDPNGLWLGCDQDSVGGGWEKSNQFDGILDEFRIYNRALSLEEVKQHYEQGPTALSFTKTAPPQSIKQGQTTTMTPTVKNTGSTEISDIEIADVIPKDLTLIDGETTKTYTSLLPKDSRQFQYSVHINEAGTFNLGQATASYADNKGNYQTIKSKPSSIEVIPSLVTDSKQTPSRKSNNNAQSASVNLHGEKTDVVMGEDILLRLSAVNLITKLKMHVQVIIIPPSGMSVTSSEFSKSAAGQFTANYQLEPGDGKDIEVRIRSNQIGDFNVKGRIVYYFGEDKDKAEDHTLNLPIKVRKEPGQTAPAGASDVPAKAPGFGGGMAIKYRGAAPAGLKR